MSNVELNEALQAVAAQHLPPPVRQPSDLIEQLFRRDTSRMRLLAAASLICWLASAAGVALLLVGLNRFVIDVRIHHLLPGTAAVDDSLLLDATDLLHHSMPFLAGSAAAMMLAALFTVLLVFTSRQSTMNRISASLGQIAEEIRHIRGGAFSELTSVGQSDSRRLQASSAGRMMLALGIAAIAVLLGTLTFIGLQHASPMHRSIAWQTAPRLAPFDAVRWHDRQPQVHVDGQWFELIAVDGVAVEQILAADTSPGIAWQQKHFGEDIVELMSRLGHPTGNTVAMTVRSSPAGDTHVLTNVPMTAANRTAVLDADLAAGAGATTRSVQ